MQERYEELDLLKGWTMILVYLGHCFQLGGINITRNAFSNFYIHGSIYSFHMPLFFIISGFLSNNSREIEFKSFYKGKIIRLLVPYLFINLIDYILRTLFPQLVNSKFEGIRELLLNGTKISWFVYTLFILFMVFPFLDKYILKKDKYCLFGIVLLLLNYTGLFSNIRMFSMNMVVYYLIYFYLGYILKGNIVNKKCNNFVKDKSFYIFVFIFIFFSYKYYNLNLLTKILFAIIGSLISLNFIFRIKKYRKITDLLKFIGINSLAFYLLEGFISVVYRVLLIKIIPLEFNNILVISFFLLKIITAYLLIKYIVIRSSTLSLLLGVRKE